MSGRAVGFVASFGIPIALVRIFDRADFGTYKQLFLIATTLYGIGQLGMAESLFYFLPKAPSGAARYVANAALSLAAGGLACLAALVLGGPALARWLGNPDLARHTTALGVYVMLWLASAALEIVMIARKRYRWASGLYGGLDVLRAACLVLPALVSSDLEWLVAGAVGFAAVRVAVTLAYFRREFGPELSPDVPLFRQQLAYAMPFALAGLVEIAQVNLHQYAVAYRFDAATFAVYAVGCLQVPLVELVTASLVNVMMVRMAEELRDGRPEAARAIWHDSARKLALLFVPLAALLMVAARPIMVFLFTARYAASAPIFLLSSLALLWPVLAVDGVLRVFAATRFLFALNVVRLALTVALLWWLIGELGLIGAMAATVIAGGAARAIGLVRIGGLMNLPLAQILPWRDFGAIVGAAAIAAAPAAAALPVGLELGILPALVATGAVYGLSYVACLWSFGGITTDEWMAARRALARWRIGSSRAGLATEVSAPCVESRD